MQHLCSESLLSTFTPTLLSFFLPSLFLGLHFRAFEKCIFQTFRGKNSKKAPEVDRNWKLDSKSLFKPKSVFFEDWPCKAF